MPANLLPDPRTPLEQYQDFVHAVTPVNRELAFAIGRNLGHARRTRDLRMRAYWVNTARYQHRWLLANRRTARDLHPSGLRIPFPLWPPTREVRPHPLTPLYAALEMDPEPLPVVDTRTFTPSEWPAGEVEQVSLF